MNHNKSTRKARSKGCVGGRKLRRPFPYLKVAKLWGKNKTIAEIARAVGRVDKHNPKDPFHSLRNFLRIMHVGYVNANGRIVLSLAKMLSGFNAFEISNTHGESLRSVRCGKAM
jgi:hypothetical protein